MDGDGITRRSGRAGKRHWHKNPEKIIGTVFCHLFHWLVVQVFNVPEFRSLNRSGSRLESLKVVIAGGVDKFLLCYIKLL